MVEYNRWTGPSFFHLYKQLSLVLPGLP
eukprot:COSAG02_NODE_84339_length_100_cov_324595.000000_1_plen_27_part_01